MTFQIACVHTHLGDLHTGYLDEAEYDVKNYVGRGDCYLQRTKLFLPTTALFLKLPGCTKAGCNNGFITHSKSRKKSSKNATSMQRSVLQNISYFSAVSGYEGIFILADILLTADVYRQ